MNLIRLCGAVAVLLVASLANAQPFSFQGFLANPSGNPYTGVFDLEFRLYEHPVEPAPAAGPVTVNDIDIVEGVVNTEIDFGQVFAYGDFWLEIGVRPGASTGPYDYVSPRTPIRPVPSAITAMRVNTMLALDAQWGQNLEVKAPYDMRFYLDADNNDANEWFSVFNGDQNEILRLTEDGKLIANFGGADDGVQLPVSSISSVETKDEAGGTSGFTSGLINVTFAVNPLVTKSITTPAAGLVIALASAEMSINFSNLSRSEAEIGISTSASSFDDDSLALDFESSFVGGATYIVPVSIHDVYQVNAGTHTFHFVARHNAGLGTGAWDARLTLIYVPTIYGTVSSSSPAAIFDERQASIQANQERIERELAEVQSKIEALEKQVEK